MIERLLLASFLLPLVLLVLVLPVIHDPADGWIGLTCHLDEIEVLVGGHVERLLRVDDADLTPVGPNHSDLRHADAVVHSQFRCDNTAPFLDDKNKKPMTPRSDATGGPRGTGKTASAWAAVTPNPRDPYLCREVRGSASKRGSAPSWLSLSQGIIAGDVGLLVTGVSEAERAMSDDERNEQEARATS